MVLIGAFSVMGGVISAAESDEGRSAVQAAGCSPALQGWSGSIKTIVRSLHFLILRVESRGRSLEVARSNIFCCGVP